MVGATGPEPADVSAFQNKGLRNRPDAGGAVSGAVSADSTPEAPDLQAVIAAWPGLPEAVRARIVAMVQTADTGGE